MSHSIAKNTAFMTGASIAQKVISFIYFTLIARSIGVEGTGKYFLAMSFTTIFVVFVDLGLSNVLVREAAKMRENIQKYLSTILSVKLIFGVFSYITVVVLAYFLYPADAELRSMIYLSGVTMLFDSFNLTVYSVLRAIGDLRFESISITLSQFLSLIFGGVFLWLHLPLVFLILAFTIPSAINACYAAVVLYKRYHVLPSPHFEKKTFLFLWKITIPFALAAIFARVYGYIDSILLKQMLGTEAVGWYSTPYKITYAFQFVPLALTAAIYPRMSEYFVTQKEKLSVILHDSIKYLLVVSMPIAIGICVLAKPIILMLYGDAFLPSVLPLQILILSLVFSFVGFPIGACLNACNRQVTQTSIVAVVMVLNIILNVLLIPKIGVAGAALAALFGNTLLTFAGYCFLPQITAISHGQYASTFFRVLFCAIVMGLAVYFVNTLSNVFVAIIAGAIVYASMIFVTRVLTFAEVVEARRMLRK